MVREQVRQALDQGRVALDPELAADDLAFSQPMIDALQMVSGRAVEAVSGTLDLAGRPDCRGEQFRDPGGWGIGRIGPVTEGLAIFLIGIVALVFTTLWIAGKS